jgi:hypothetical protein
MAPEQLSGEKPTVQSDIYALGLVLYELFTGKQAYSAASISETLELRRQGPPPKISGIVKGLDPAIERTILQCLDKEPRSRPRSALQVNAALPGGDQLAAAIAGGETPSPEMVAAAADPPLLSVGRLWLMGAALVAAFVVLGFAKHEGGALGLAPLGRSPEAMAEHARQVVASLGYQSPPADSAYWYEADEDYLQYRASHGSTPERARQLATALPGPTRFVYRQSPHPLAPMRIAGPVTDSDPPNDVPGMLSVVLDASGRLLYFSVVPVEAAEPIPATDTDWIPLLSAAGLDANQLTAVSPRSLPPTFRDRQASWAGVLGGEAINVAAASYQGKPVYFKVTGLWTPARPGPAPVTDTAGIVLNRATIVLWLVILAVGVLLARRNIRMGRGDRQGALRIAGVVFIADVVLWALRAHYVGDVSRLWGTIAGVLEHSLFEALAIYVIYLALEPYVRRRWPQFLVSWNRVLSGRFHDARVGRDVLAGCLAGPLIHTSWCVPFVLATWFNLPGQPPAYYTSGALRGLTWTLTDVAFSLNRGITDSLAIAICLVVARFLLRRDWLVVVPVGLLLLPGVPDFPGARPVVDVPAAVTAVAVILFMIFRFGMLGMAVAEFTNFLVALCIPTLDFSRWYIWPSVLSLTIVAALAIFSFRAALAGRPVFGRPILEE